MSVGDIDLVLEDLSIGGGLGGSTRINRFAVKASSALDGDRIDVDGQTSMAIDQLPLGAVSYEMTFRVGGVDAAAVGALQRKIEEMGDNPDPMAAYASLEPATQRLFAAGLEIDIEQLDVTLPQGTMTSVMQFSFKESDPATFDWSSLLLNSEASIDVSVPAEVVETFAQGNPQAALVIGAGYLVKRGDVYVMEARLKKGLLTVNGAPIPIPLGAM